MLSFAEQLPQRVRDARTETLPHLSPVRWDNSLHRAGRYSLAALRNCSVCNFSSSGDMVVSVCFRVRSTVASITSCLRSRKRHNSLMATHGGMEAPIRPGGRTEMLMRLARRVRNRVISPKTGWVSVCFNMQNPFDQWVIWSGWFIRVPLYHWQ